MSDFQVLQEKASFNKVWFKQMLIESRKEYLAKKAAGEIVNRLETKEFAYTVGQFFARVYGMELPGSRLVEMGKIIIYGNFLKHLEQDSE